MHPKALRRAVANLIDNAWRHAGQEQPIRLALLRNKDDIFIDVCDRGPGIPADEVERLKQPFTRLENARSNISGAGLGLAIVERIARSHGGALHLLPREDGGLVARISLPAKGCPTSRSCRNIFIVGLSPAALACKVRIIHRRYFPETIDIEDLRI